MYVLLISVCYNVYYNIKLCSVNGEKSADELAHCAGKFI